MSVDENLGYRFRVPAVSTRALTRKAFPLERRQPEEPAEDQGSIEESGMLS